MKTLTFLLALLALVARAQTLPPGFSSTTLSGGWNEPVGLAFPDPATEQMLVWERPGKVWTIVNNQRQLLLDLTEEVGGWNDHGLLGLALDPQFATNGYFYLLYVVDRHHLLYAGTANYNAAANEYFAATIGRLTRYTARPDAGGRLALVAGSRRVLLGATASTGIPSLASGHVACSLVFGTDGSLLVGTGDGAHPYQDTGSSPDSFFAQALSDGIIRPAENVGSFRAQLVDCLSGKVLRLDPATGLGLPSNPFYDPAAPGAPRSKVWALGCRNPFRLDLKPETGSHDPAAGNPGTLYVADVGSSTWEEVTAVTGPGQNLGWPLFEGLTPLPTFATRPTANRDAPNPRLGTGGCTQAYFNFQDLLQQAASPAPPALANPCGGPLPAGVRQFVHKRPLLDYGHAASGPVRTGTFGSGGAAGTVTLGAAGSPLTGPTFGGSAVVGGVFYPHHDFPEAYHDAYLLADYTTGWIRGLTVSAADAPSALTPLLASGSVAVGLAVHPSRGGLYYANFYPGEIRKISYLDPNPTAVATANRRFGPGPLAVQFAGSASASANGSALTYAWVFGDGGTSALPNPAHTFAPAGPAPVGYAVGLTVTDGAGRTATAAVPVSVNNTPPLVRITSPAAGTRYPVTALTAYTLRATVSDAEHPASQLRYAWQTWLHHNNHEHPEPVDTARQSSLTTSPLGCGPETYYYRVRLTVTDAAGLSAFDEVRLDPACGPQVSSFTLVNADTDLDIRPLAAGDVLNLALLPTRNLNIRANPAPGPVGSVVFALSGAATRAQTETVPPYALFSDDAAGNYFAWTPPVGSYTLLATPYAGGGGSGAAGTPLSIGFSVIDQGTAGPFTLVTNVVGSGTVARAPAQASYPAGTLVTLTATPAAGFQFGGWSGDTTAAANPLALRLRRNRSLTATFTAIVPPAGSFTLVNADTDLDIRPLVANDVLNLALLPTRNLNIRANPAAGSVGSVVFALSGAATHAQTESVPPYALFSDEGGNYFAWTPPLGSYTVLATPYAGGGGSGAAGPSFSLSFSVIDQVMAGQFTLATATVGSGTVARSPAQASYPAGTLVTLTATPAAGFRFGGWSGDTTAAANPLALRLRRNRSLTATFVLLPQSVVSFTLVNADTDLDLQPLPTGSTINLALLPTRNLNIRANTSPAAVGSVVFALSGTVVHGQTESVPPYALYSDDGGNYDPWTPPVGSYTVLATPYTGGGGSGTAGTALSLAFSVIDAPAGPGGGGPALRASAAPNPAPDARYRVVLSAPRQGAWQYVLVSAMGHELARGTRELPANTRELTFDFGPALPTSPGLAYLLLYPTAGRPSQGVRIRLAR